MKRLFYLAMFLLAAITVSAGQVDLATAQQAAQRLLMNKAHNGRMMASSTPAVKWIHQERNSSRADMVAYYVVNTDKGFVIVSGDDRAQEILAYGDTDIKDMKSLPENMKLSLIEPLRDAEDIYDSESPIPVTTTAETIGAITLRQ